MVPSMSEIMTPADRDAKSGRFLPGNSGFGGRPKGSRNRLAESIIEDLKIAWNEHGTTALERCAAEDPTAFCKIVAGLLPKDIDINLTAAVDVADFTTRFRDAVQLLGNDPPRLRKPPRTTAARTIEHDANGDNRG
jgi:hypothetical protein